MPSNRKTSRDRRAFLGGVGAGIAAAAIGPRARAAAGQDPASAVPLKVVDFHNHYLGPSLASKAGGAAPPALQAYWAEVNRNLGDEGRLTASIDAAGIAARVVNTPLEFIQNADGEASAGLVQRINDQLAGLVSRNPGRLHALATVDAYRGDAGAREVTRAVRELGLRGVFVESAKGNLFLDAPQARPTLATAAELEVPVFVHPITDPDLQKRFAKFGRLGVTLNRSTINAAALFALLESGTFDQLPDLRIVVTTLALGGVLLAGGFNDGHKLRQDAAALARRHIYIDTMGLHPVLVGAAVDLLGADHVLAGTDWPIFTERSVAERLQKALTAAGLDRSSQEMVAGGNTLKLLKVT